MKLRKLLVIVSALIILLAVAVGLISINHPIILKWVTGSARHFGKPIPATVFINGQVNEHVKIFYTDDPDNYLISLAGYDSSEIKFLNIDLNQNRIGISATTSLNDYDFIAGHLFQSKASEHFSPFPDDAFDPHLSFTDDEIKFNISSNKLKIDSIRVRLH